MLSRYLFEKNYFNYKRVIENSYGTKFIANNKPRTVPTTQDKNRKASISASVLNL